MSFASPSSSASSTRSRGIRPSAAHSAITVLKPAPFVHSLLTSAARSDS